MALGIGALATALTGMKLKSLADEDTVTHNGFYGDRCQKGDYRLCSFDVSVINHQLDQADALFDSTLVYEPSVIKVFADRYLLEVPQDHPAFVTAHRLRQLIDRFITIYPDHVPPTSILREFIGGSGFEY